MPTPAQAAREEAANTPKSITIDGVDYLLKPRLKIKALKLLGDMDADGFAERAVLDPTKASAFAEGLEVDDLERIMELYVPGEATAS